MFHWLGTGCWQTSKHYSPDLDTKRTKDSAPGATLNAVCTTLQ